MTETETIEFKMELTKLEADTLRQIRGKILKDDGEQWSFQQILSECAAISLSNWRQMNLITKLTPRSNA